MVFLRLSNAVRSDTAPSVRPHCERTPLRQNVMPVSPSRRPETQGRLPTMARARAPQPVKLFAGLLGGDVDLLRRARQLLARRFGSVDAESEVWPFEQTDYYEDEMGTGLKRWFVGFEPLVAPGQIAQIKHETNALEQEIADQCLAPDIARPVNIDPGYVDLTKLVLATTKDRGHRLYVGHGIYAEVTLQYAGGGWQVQPWTYPDYALPATHAFFLRLRDRLRAQRQELADAPDQGPP